MNKFKSKILSISLIWVLVMGNLWVPAIVFGAPERPSLPSSPSQTETPETPEAAETPELPGSSTEEVVSEVEDSPNPTPIIEGPQLPEEPELPGENDEEEEDEEDFETVEDDSNLEEGISPSGGSSGYSSDGQVGDPRIETGESNVSGVVINTGNNNYIGSGYGGSGIGSVGIANEGNGTLSTNTGSATLDTTNTNTQDNLANVNNSLVLSSATGENSTSRNVGTSSIDTGEANVTGTIINSLNTNVDGVMVAEFNVDDDYIGDLILDFSAYCIGGCSGNSIDIANTDNGSDSTNTGEVDLTEINNTFQGNDATLENELILSANSGDNTADNNTGGDSTIETGDANVVGNILNFVNNNLAGNVIYGVVNIFGDLVGDIILPEEYIAQLAYYGSSYNLSNTNNGSESTNSADLDQDITNNFTQTNDAQILNNVILDATTGDNTTSDNTGGDNSIETGDIDIDASVVNIANTNVVGGTWWIVLVNEAGNWFGRILGSPQGSNFAGSQGTQFALAPDGTINISNDGNGTGSTNTGDVTTSQTNNTTQENTAVITNNIDLSANTGGNSASRNTGGNSSVTTGDASIMLNLVNFVNNNFAGGNVVFTVVNVFGSWLGDFVTPGTKKENVAAQPNPPADPSTPPQGGTSDSGGSQVGGSVSTGSDGVVLGSNTSASGQGRLGFSYSSPATQIAGFTASIETGENSPAGTQIGGDLKKKLRVNLAWLFVIIPLSGAALFGISKLNKKLA